MKKKLLFDIVNLCSVTCHVYVIGIFRMFCVILLIIDMGTLSFVVLMSQGCLGSFACFGELLLILDVFIWNFKVIDIFGGVSE